MKLLLSATILTITGLLPVATTANTINFDTSTAPDWQVTGGGAVNATPYVVNVNNDIYVGNVISVTSDATYTGTFVQGGSLANFDGFWTATFSFSLPSSAANVQLGFANFVADDRGVLMLNGNVISSSGLPVGGSYAGTMIFTDGGAAVPYTFNSPSGQVSGVVNSGFNIGGINTLTAIMNNTDNGVLGPLVNVGPFDGTGLGLTGSISYTTVPEPSLAALALMGLGCTPVFRARQIRK